MEERGLRRCAGQSGHRRFIGADMVSWIEIKMNAQIMLITNWHG